MKFRRIAHLAVSIVFCLTLCVPFTAHAVEQVSDAPDADASTIRVVLSTNNQSVIPITVSGFYSVAERPDLYTLPPGNYRVANSGGGLRLLNAAGSALASGLRTITLVEHINADGHNLIALTAKGKPYRYLGNMKFWPDRSYVMAVNHIYLDKYLYGVVANEMGSSFPIEALKAQAVAARCYAYKTLEGTRGPRYDINDTASTQAYSGYTGNSKIIQAVDDTARQVLEYNGEIITAYFAASNGGQTDRTENVWSVTLPYFAIREDPYDLVRGPTQTVYFPIGDSADKPGDMPTIPLQPEAIAQVYGDDKIAMYRRPDTGSAVAATLDRGDFVWIYEINSAWVKAKSGDTVGFIPANNARVFTIRAIVPSGQPLLSAASLGSNSLLALPQDAVVTLKSYGAWCLVEYNGKLGYIPFKSLVLTPYEKPPALDLQIGSIFTVTTAGALRSAASIGSRSLARLEVASRVTLVQADAGWYKVTYNGRTGYMPQNSLQLVIPSLVLTAESYEDAPPPSDNIRYSQDDMDPRLINFIKTMAVKSLSGENAKIPEAQRYILSFDSIAIKSIDDVTCYQSDHQPLCLHLDGHAAADCPSIDFTGARITATLKARKRNLSKQGGYDNVDYKFTFQFYIPETLKSDAFPQWKVFTRDYRIFAVKKGTDSHGTASFLLINRRFGHGIGMSQWGAYSRALSSDPEISRYTSILSFYYPGTSLSALDINEEPLTPRPTKDGTPIPPPPPPRLKKFIDF